MSDTVFFDDPIRLAYFHSWPNFGDRLSRSLVEYLTGRSVLPSDRENGELMAVGSLLREDLMFSDKPCEFMDDGDELNIWGSGFWNPKIIEDRPYYPKRKLNIHALRGGLSLDILKKIDYLPADYECALGDPGILFPDLVDLSMVDKASYELALVPHMLDMEEFKPLYSKFVEAGIDVRYIDVTQNDSLNVIRQMAGAKRVLSSSLHGLILADALHIPNRRVKSDIYETDKRHINSISDFKFADYYSAFDMLPSDSIKVKTLLDAPLGVFELVGDRDLVPPDIMEDRKKNLLNSFPGKYSAFDFRKVPEDKASPVLTVVIICDIKDECYLHSCILSAVRQVEGFKVQILCLEGEEHSTFAMNLQKLYSNVKFIETDSKLSVKERILKASDNINGRYVIVIEASDMIDIERIADVCSEEVELYGAQRGLINDEGTIIEDKKTDFNPEKLYLGNLYSASLFMEILSLSTEEGLSLIRKRMQAEGERIVFHREKAHLDDKAKPKPGKTNPEGRQSLNNKWREVEMKKIFRKYFCPSKENKQKNIALSEKLESILDANTKATIKLEKILDATLKSVSNIKTDEDGIKAIIDKANAQLGDVRKEINTQREELADTKRLLIDGTDDLQSSGTERKGKLIAVNNYSKGGVSYIQSIHTMLEERYEVISYEMIKRKLISLDYVAVIYLNWIENNLSDEDKKLLEEAHARGVKIIWVFHNKIAHDRSDTEFEISKIKYMIDISDIILILSAASRDILKKYAENTDEEKIKILPHTNYVGNYGNLSCPSWDFSKNSDLFTFAFAGAIRPYKNLELLIEAFNRFEYRDKCRLIISGKVSNQEYSDSLKPLSESENIQFLPGEIPSAMMEKYIHYSDVVVLPYDYKSSMNSGAMMLAFSCQRTVIIPRIEMTYDFDDSLMYCYDYTTQKDHIEKLTEMMKKAFTDGRETVLARGEEAYKIVKDRYSRKSIKKQLYKLIDPFMPAGELPRYVQNDIMLIRELNKCRDNSLMNDCFNLWVQNNNNLSSILKYSGVRNVAIWGANNISKQIYKDLRENGISVDYIVAGLKNAHEYDVPVFQSSADLPGTEYVIVTVSEANMYWLFKKFNTQESSTRVITIKEF